MNEIEKIIKNRFSKAAEEIVERFMDAKLILDFNDLLIKNTEENLEEVIDTIAVTLKDKQDNGTDIEDDITEAVEILLKNQSETVRLNTIFNVLQKTPNMHEKTETVENIIKELFENSKFETAIYILGKLQNHFKKLYFEEQRQKESDEKC